MIVHVLRKPLTGTVAANALQHGCGALNIDECRIGFASEADKASAFPGGNLTAKSGSLAGGVQNNRERSHFDTQQHSAGRWPANLVHDGSDRVMAIFPAEAGSNSGQVHGSDGMVHRKSEVWGTSVLPSKYPMYDKSRGSASRFFQHVEVSHR